MTSFAEAEPDQTAIPDAVFSFYRSLNRHLLSRSVFNLHQLYENDFPKISDRYFSSSSWPTIDELMEGLNSETAPMSPIAPLLYQDLYFRHIYARLTPDVDDRLDAFDSYVRILTALLEISPDSLLGNNKQSSPLAFELPLNWAWEIIEQAIACFQEFHTFRQRVNKLTDEDKENLTVNPDAWNPTTFMSFLYFIAKKANLSVHAPAGVQDTPVPSNTQIPQFFITMGNFAVIGLSRLHCLLCDYVSALSVLSSFDLRATSSRTVLQAVPSCQASLYYYLAFSYFMMRRYTDACKTCNVMLVNKSRREAKAAKSSTNPVTNEAVSSMIESLQHLLAMSHVLSAEHVDEGALAEVKEKMGDKFARLQRLELSAFEELFLSASPRFVVCTMPNYGAEQPVMQTPSDVKQQQWHFLSTDLQSRAQLPPLLSYLSLFSSVSLSKLSAHLNLSEEETSSMLLGLRGRCLQWRWSGGSPEHGRMIDTLDMSLSLEGEKVQVKQETSVRKHGDFFLRQISKLREVQKELDDLTVTAPSQSK